MIGIAPRTHTGSASRSVTGMTSRSPPHGGALFTAGDRPRERAETQLPASRLNLGGGIRLGPATRRLTSCRRNPGPTAVPTRYDGAPFPTHIDPASASGELT